jgi:hypothetical protein
MEDGAPADFRQKRPAAESARFSKWFGTLQTGQERLQFFCKPQVFGSEPANFCARWFLFKMTFVGTSSRQHGRLLKIPFSCVAHFFTHIIVHQHLPEIHENRLHCSPDIQNCSPNPVLES